MKTRRLCIDGTRPGVVVVDIDPPLLADEIEINVDDDDAESAIESMTIAERAALSDLLAPRAHQR